MAEVVTGEAVVLDVPCARFPSRLLALILDLLTQVVLLFLVLGAVGLVIGSARLDPAAGAAIALTSTVIVIVGYPVIWETATRGRTPGMYALGLRVVGDDGSPERFRQALVRGLTSVVEIWLFTGLPALIASLISSRGKRLGDLFAGTFVIQQRLPSRYSTVYLGIPPALDTWAQSLDLSSLDGRTAETARRYLARLTELRPHAQEYLGAQIASAVTAQVSPLPPPGVPVPVYLGTVLAERRRRDQSLWPPPAPSWPAPPAPSWPAPPAPSWPAPPRVPGPPSPEPPADPPTTPGSGFVPPS
jgi:uncharacterized RDD family membrane protein YckC